MRRYLYAALGSAILMAALPASSVARSTRFERHHHHRRHDSILRTERFGEHQGGTTTKPSSQGAGSVMSLENSVLTIKLRDGSTVRGLVTATTGVECGAMNDELGREDRGPGSGDGGGSGSSGNGGPSSSGSGGPGSIGGGDNGDNGGDRGAGGADRGDRGDDRGDRGEDRGDRGEGDERQNCLMALSTPGTVVREARLRVSSAGPVWQEIDLGS